MSRYQQLKKGEMKMSGMVRDDRILLDKGKIAAFYCGVR